MFKIEEIREIKEIEGNEGYFLRGHPGGVICKKCKSEKKCINCVCLSCGREMREFIKGLK